MDDGPCGTWTFDLPCATDEVDAGVLAAAKAAATLVLWALGGRRHGTCAVTLRPSRPCAATASWATWGHGYQPVLHDGVWLNVCGHCDPCSCGNRNGLLLEAAPLSSVVAVTLDGEELPEWDPTAGVEGWTLIGGRLYRVLGDGRQHPTGWPSTQALHLPRTEVGTFAVEVLAGLDVDALGLLAAGELACELLKATTGDEKLCRLPSRLVALSRQGVSMTFADVTTVLEDRRVGLPLCDMWIGAVNPNRLEERAEVYSVDRPLRRGSDGGSTSGGGPITEDGGGP